MTPTRGFITKLFIISQFNRVEVVFINFVRYPVFVFVVDPAFFPAGEGGRGNWYGKLDNITTERDFNDRRRRAGDLGAELGGAGDFAQERTTVTSAWRAVCKSGAQRRPKRLATHLSNFSFCFTLIVIFMPFTPFVNLGVTLNRVTC